MKRNQGARSKPASNRKSGPPTRTGRALTEAELASATGGAFDAFVNFGDIKGECTDKDHKDWIMTTSTSRRGVDPTRR